VAGTTVSSTTLSTTTGTPVDAVASTGTFSFGGAVIDGETVTIGTEVFEFDMDSSVSGGNTALDISGGSTVAATATLTSGGVALHGETVTINGRVYEFDSMDTPEATGDVVIDINEASGYSVKADGTLTVVGTDVHGDTLDISTQTITLKADTTAEDADNMTLRGLTGVVAATATFGLGGPVTDTKIVTLGTRAYEFSTDGVAGVGDVAIDLSGSSTAKDDALTAFETAVNNDGNADCTAVKDLAANEITFTAIVHGTPGNALVSTTDEPAGAFVTGQGSGGTFTGGANCTATVLAAAYEAHLTAYPISYIDHVDNLDDTLTLTWKKGGVAGNSVTFDATGLTGSSGDGANVLGGTTAGVDCTTNQAIAAFVAAIGGDSGAEVTTADTAPTAIVTWKMPGTIGNGKVTAESGAQLSWDGNLGTTAAGVDATASEGHAALLAKSGSTTADVTLTDAGGDVLTVTSDIAGVIGDLIALAESSANITISGANLGAGAGVDGVDGTVGVAGEIRWDASNIYICTATNTTADSNWKKAALSAL
jgi:hypothetical protein